MPGCLGALRTRMLRPGAGLAPHCRGWWGLGARAVLTVGRLGGQQEQQKRSAQGGGGPGRWRHGEARAGEPGSRERAVKAPGRLKRAADAARQGLRSSWPGGGEGHIPAAAQRRTRRSLRFWAQKEAADGGGAWDGWGWGLGRVGRGLWGAGPSWVSQGAG